MGNAVHREFERKRNQPLDLFRGVTGPLRDEFDLRGSKIGIGIHGHALKGNNPSDRHKHGEHQHQESLMERGLYDSMDHSLTGPTVIAMVPC